MNESNSRTFAKEDALDILPLARELCAFRSGVVADDNEPLFARLCAELPFTLHRFATGETHNGWVVPKNRRVHMAKNSRDGEVLYDGTVHALGVGIYSRSFEGELDWEELKPYLVTNPDLPGAYIFHSMWRIRSSAADWALLRLSSDLRANGSGRYRVDLVTSYEPGEVMVAEYEKKDRTDDVIIFNTNTCHPTQANDETVWEAPGHEKQEDCDFVVTPSRDPEAEESRYVLLQRGYVDTSPARGGDMTSDEYHRRGGMGG